MEYPLFTIVNVMAVSLDGKIATQADERDDAREEGGFTSPDDRAHLEELIRDADAIIVGSSSIKATGGAIDVSRRDGSMPLWVVFSNRGLPDQCLFYHQDHIPRWLVSKQSLEEVPKDIPLLTYGSECPATFIVSHLKAKGAKRVLLFGGSEINKLFYQADLVDELIVTICPIIIGQSRSIPLVAPELRTPKHFRLESSLTKSNLVFLRYRVVKPD